MSPLPATARTSTVLLAFVCLHLAGGAVRAQQAVAEAPRALTADDYRQAEKFMSYSVAPLVLRASVRPTWLEGDRFWFRNTTEQGSEFVLLDATAGTRRPAFSHEKVAAALSIAAGAQYDPQRLPFQTFEFSSDERAISVTVARRRYTCDVEGARCVADEAGQERSQASAPAGPPVRTEALSPDKRFAAFIRSDNLWIREVATRKETQLTTDGVKDYGYATDNAGWRRSDGPILAWSPDSKKIASFRQDQRGVGEMYLVETKVGRPTLQAWKYPLPGDATVALIERVVIHVDGPRVVRLNMPPDQHRSTICDDLACRGEWGDVQWSPDSTRLAFASVSRDHKEVTLREADATTGAVRDVLAERVTTFFESGNGRVSWRYLPTSNEVIWYSRRDNWGHLYLYDLRTGQLKNRITSGEGNVAQLLRVDEKARTILFIGNGREPGRDPYFRHLYRVGLDGTNLALLTPEDADHDVSISRSGRFITDSYSKPDVPPVAVLRDTTGRQVTTIEKADISRLVASGWKPPVPFTVKARDGVTDLYGLMFRPTRFDPSKKYPIINSIYPGPQQGSVGSRSFSAARGDTQALAELGFVVVQIDAMGTPGRSRAFHEASYGNMGDNGLPDQVAGMKQARRPVPLDRPRPRRRLRPLRRRVRRGRCDVPLPRLLQGGRVPGRQPRQPRLRRRLGREVAGPARDQRRRHDQLRQPGEPARREEPEGQAPARARHDGQQRAALQHPAGGQRADQGQQGLRPDPVPEPRAWVRGRALHGATSLGLLRPVPARRRTTEGLRTQAVNFHSGPDVLKRAEPTRPSSAGPRPRSPGSPSSGSHP